MRDPPMREGGPPKGIERGFFVMQAGQVHPDRWILIPTIGWDPRWVALALDRLDQEIFAMAAKIRKESENGET